MRQRTLQFLQPNDWQLLQNRATIMTFKLGDEILHAGLSVHHLYIIRQGSVWVELPTARSEVVLAVLQEGDIFGEIAFIDDGKATATVVAKDLEVQVEAIPFHELRVLCGEIPGFGMRLFQSLGASLARRLRNTSAELVRATNAKAGNGLPESTFLVPVPRPS